MVQRSRAHAPSDISGTAIFNRENADQVDEFELVLDAADINVNLAAADV